MDKQQGRSRHLAHHHWPRRIPNLRRHSYAKYSERRTADASGRNPLRNNSTDASEDPRRPPQPPPRQQSARRTSGPAEITLETAPHVLHIRRYPHHAVPSRIINAWPSGAAFAFAHGRQLASKRNETAKAVRYASHNTIESDIKARK